MREGSSISDTACRYASAPFKRRRRSSATSPLARQDARARLEDAVEGSVLAVVVASAMDLEPAPRFELHGSPQIHSSADAAPNLLDGHVSALEAPPALRFHAQEQQRPRADRPSPRTPPSRAFGTPPRYLRVKRVRHKVVDVLDDHDEGLVCKAVRVIAPISPSANRSRILPCPDRRTSTPSATAQARTRSRRTPRRRTLRHRAPPTRSRSSCGRS